MKRTIIYLLAIVSLLSSCSKDNGPVGDPSGRTDAAEISLRASGATKSAFNGSAFPQAYDMLVSAYRNLGSYPGADAATNYFQGIHFAYDGVSGHWKSSNGAKFYPLYGTLDFLAVASAGLRTAANGIIPTAVWGDAGGNVAKKVVLTVPDNGAKFDDLMYGASNGQWLYNSCTDIEFNHAMSCIVFLAKGSVSYDAVTNTGITIDAITVDNAKYGGTLTVQNPSAAGGIGDVSAAWSSLGSAREHVAARVWNAANLGNNPSETALSGLNLTTSYKSLASYKFGEAYVILPPQDATSFTVTCTFHKGFEADGITEVEEQVEYILTPAGSWAMGKKHVYELYIKMTGIVMDLDVVDWDIESDDATF